jgi:hypothetical protein
MYVASHLQPESLVWVDRASQSTNNADAGDNKNEHRTRNGTQGLTKGTGHEVA